jgi:hypothetical protein
LRLPERTALLLPRQLLPACVQYGPPQTSTLTGSRVAAAPNMRAALFAVLFVDHCEAQRSLQVAPPPAYYPRLLGGNNITGSPLAIGVVEAPTDAEKRLVMLRRTDLAPAEAWAVAETVISVPFAADVDLSNGYLLPLPSGVLLCAYRHHNGTGTNRVFRIQVSASKDGGATWAQISTVTSGPVGVWEPLLFQFSSDDAQTVQIYYSAELINLGEQDVVRQTSTDGGKTWGAVDARVHTANSRNGMPGVIEVADGSAVLVFEGFWGPWGWNHFVSTQTNTSFANKHVIYPNPLLISDKSPGRGQLVSPLHRLCKVAGRSITVRPGFSAASSTHPRRAISTRARRRSQCVLAQQRL